MCRLLEWLRAVELDVKRRLGELVLEVVGADDCPACGAPKEHPDQARCDHCDLELCRICGRVDCAFPSRHALNDI